MGISQAGGKKIILSVLGGGVSRVGKTCFNSSSVMVKVVVGDLGDANLTSRSAPASISKHAMSNLPF